MNRLILLLEERSMKVLLDGLIPRFFPELPFICVAHEGKQDLEKSIPRKLRGWREPGALFLVLRDNDGADCRRLKRRLQNLCKKAGRPDSIVRLACQELEAWYLGEPEAMAGAFGRPKTKAIVGRSGFRDPDNVARPSEVITRMIPEFQKVSGARWIAAHLSREGNSSRSFQAFLRSLELVKGRIKGEN